MKSLILTVQTLFIAILLILPGCCWNNCLQRCKTCNDSGLVHEPKKPLRHIDVIENNVDEDDEELCYEED